MRNFKLINSIIVIFITLNLFSQVYNPSEYRYMHNGIINPATVGNQNNLKLNISLKKQWIGINNPPSTQIVSISGKLNHYKKKNPRDFIEQNNVSKVGIGSIIYRDVNGPVKNLGAQFIYSYHFPISDKTKLSFGLAAFYNQRIIDQTNFRPYSTSDPLLNYGIEKFSRFDFNTGVLLKQEKKFSIGLSSTNFLNINSEYNGSQIYYRNYYSTADYYFQLGRIALEPSLMANYSEEKMFTFEALLFLHFNNFMFLSIGYRDYNIGLFQFGILINRYEFGYVFEYPLVDIHTYGSHLFSVRIKL